MKEKEKRAAEDEEKEFLKKVDHDMAGASVEEQEKIQKRIKEQSKKTSKKGKNAI